jgi:hypothetical protein
MFKWLKAAAGCGLALTVVLGLAFQHARVQAATSQMQRRAEPLVATKMSPVVVTKITHGDVRVQSGRFVKPRGALSDPVTPFLADDEWVQNLTVYLLNRTNQLIVYVSINLTFPETTDLVTRFRAGYQVHLGRIPAAAAYENGRPVPQPPERQPILFQPGQILAVHLGDYIDEIKADVERARPLAGLTTIHVNLSMCYFAGGGLRWNGGYSVFDPQSHAWQPIARGYFPGDPDIRWPGLPGWIDEQ